MKLDVMRNLKIPSQDPEIVKKVGIGGLASFLVVTAPLLLGYQMEIIRSTADGYTDGLPPMRDYGKLWITGALASVVMLMLVMIPTSIVGGGILAGALAMGLTEGGGLFAGLGVIAGVLMLLGLMLLFSVVCPALLLRYTMTGELWALVNLRQAFADIMVAPIDYCVLLVVPFVGGMVGAIVGAPTAGIAAVFVGAYTTFVLGRLMGDYYRLHLQ